MVRRQRSRFTTAALLGLFTAVTSAGRRSDPGPPLCSGVAHHRDLVPIPAATVAGNAVRAGPGINDAEAVQRVDHPPHSRVHSSPRSIVLGAACERRDRPRALTCSERSVHPCLAVDGQLFGSWIRDFYPSRGLRSWSAGENLPGRRRASPPRAPAVCDAAGGDYRIVGGTKAQRALVVSALDTSYCWTMRSARSFSVPSAAASGAPSPPPGRMPTTAVSDSLPHLPGRTGRRATTS